MNTIINDFKSVYETMDASNIRIVETIYDDNITFIDPFHEIHGLEKLTEYFTELYKNVESCQFEFGDIYANDSSAMILWTMVFRHRRFRKRTINVPGSTQICFNNRIYFHRDFFDAGQMVYENIPLVGHFIKYIKRKV